MREIGEILFNAFYLVSLWIIVFNMFNKIKNIDSKNEELSKILACCFLLLALGDSAHVGFRVFAYLSGGLLVNAPLLGWGKFITGITVTIFYSLLVVAWKIRFNEKYNYFTTLLFISAIARIIIMLLPGNEWQSATAPFSFGIYRNIPLLISGLGVDYIILKSAIAADDITFKWIGIMILVSYGFYIPVILFAHKIPAIGFLMIPKTVAYLAAAFIAYNGVFKSKN